MSDFTGRGIPLSETGLKAALDTLGSTPEALWAVLSVETSGCGYLADRRPKILFERHYFHRLTGGRYSASHPDISAPSAGGYGASGGHQYDRLAAALALDADAALQSASWGLGQIMGANHKAAGFDSAQAMADAFVESEDQQLLGMARFVAASPMKAAICSHDWATFARLYNGPSYAQNQYDRKLADNCAHWTNRGCPDLAVRQAQVYLTFLGYDPGGVDGVVGPRTQAALTRFQKAQGITPDDGVPTADTLTALAQA